MYDALSDKRAYTFFPISDTANDIMQIKPIVDFLSQYEKVFIHYGKFVSVMKQEATVVDISGNKPPVEYQQIEPEPYLFEPDIKSVHSVFEKQIFYALFKQTVHEIELARNASRIQAMEKTNENILANLRKLKNREKVMRHLQQNKKQIQLAANLKYVKKRKELYANG